MMLFGRDRDLGVAVSLLQAGGSLDVVGSRSSGRTAFLDAICERVEQSGWGVVRLRGVASLRQHPLAALQLADIPFSAEVRPTTIFSAAEALHKALGDERSVVVVDDWDDLDESSWGIVEGVRRSLGAPVVMSRLQGRHARHTPSGLDAATVEPAFVIEMAPLRFEELEQAAEAFLGRPVEMGTIARLFAKSGGIVGLLLSVAAAAVREGRMRLIDGVWTASRDLWSPSLRGVVEAHLVGLPEGARDAVEIIALIGSVDVQTVRKLVDWPVLELLEQRAMVQLIPSGGRHLVTVVPPLLVEYFRHEPLAARRIRLTQLISEKLDVDTGDEALSNMSSIPLATHGQEFDALHVRMVRERLRTRRLVTRAEWEASPNADTVRDYVNALMYTAANEEHVESVLDQTDARAGSPLNRAEFVVLRAKWQAHVQRDLSGAIRRLEEGRDEAGEFAPILTAAEVTLRCTFASVPSEYATLLEVDETMPDAVRAALRDCQIRVLIALAQFSDARRVFQDYMLDTRAATYMSPTSHSLHALSLILDGAHEAGMALALRGVDEAYSFLDMEAARANGAAAVMGYMLAGDYEPIESMLGTLLAAGEIPLFPAGPFRTLLILAAMIAMRRGSTSLSERYLRELDARSSVDGLLPGQSRVWPEAQLLALNGRTVEAADALWERGEVLLARGGRMAALFVQLSAVEMVPTDARLAKVRELVASVPSPLFSAQLRFVEALSAEDTRGLLASVPDLLATGRLGFALTALRRAAEIHREAEREEEAKAMDERVAALLDAFPRKDVDAVRFSSSPVTLSARELEVARFVADGLSNPEIASRLVLSVRTVESHVHRIIRKLELPNRVALREYIESGMYR